MNFFQALVEAQRGTMANIVKITNYVTDMRYRVDLAPIREEFFGKKGPASTSTESTPNFSVARTTWLLSRAAS